MNRLPKKTTCPAQLRIAPPGPNGHWRPSVPRDPDDAIRTLPAPEFTPRLKLLRFPALRERTGLSRSTIWRMERRGEFPRHRRISEHAVAWVEEEVLIWMQARIADLAL